MSQQMKFTLVLLPYNDVIKSEISQCTKSKAIIELKLKSTKSWNDVFQYLEKKWSGVTDLESRLEIFAFDLGNSFVIDNLSYRIHDKIFSIDNSMSPSSFCENSSSSMLTVYYNLKPNGSFNNDIPTYCASEIYDLFHTENDQSDNCNVFQAENDRMPFSIPINQSLTNCHSQENQRYNNINQINSHYDASLPHNFLLGDINNSMNVHNLIISNDIQDQENDNFNYPSNEYENTYHQQSLLSPLPPPIVPPSPPTDSFLSSYQLPNTSPNAVDKQTLESTEIPSINYLNTSVPTSVTSNDVNEFTFSELDYEIDFSNFENSAMTILSAPLISINKTEILSNNILNSSNATNNNISSSDQTTKATLLENHQQQQQQQQQQCHNATENTSHSFCDLIDIDFDLDLQFSQFGNPATTIPISASIEENQIKCTNLNNNNSKSSAMDEVDDYCNKVTLSFEDINNSQELSKSAGGDTHNDSQALLPVAVGDSIAKDGGRGGTSIIVINATTTTSSTTAAAISSRVEHLTAGVAEPKHSNQEAEVPVVRQPRLVLETEAEKETVVASGSSQLQLLCEISSPPFPPANSVHHHHHHPFQEGKETQKDTVAGEKDAIYFLDKERLPPLAAVPTTSSQQLQLFKNLFLPKPRKYSEYSAETTDSHRTSHGMDRAAGGGGGGGKKRIKRCWEDGITSEDSAGDGESREGMNHHHTAQQQQQQPIVEALPGILSDSQQQQQQQRVPDIRKAVYSSPPLSSDVSALTPTKPVAGCGCATSNMATESTGSATANNNSQTSPVSFPVTVNKLFLSFKNRRKPWLRRITPTFLGPITTSE